MNKKFFNLFFIFSAFSLIFSSVTLSIQELDLDQGSFTVYMSNSEPVGGFQFNVSGVSVTGASGGSASDNGFTLSTSSTTVIGFSLTASTIAEGTDIPLLNIDFNGSADEVCITDIVVSSD